MAAFVLALPTWGRACSSMPDLTAAGLIAALKTAPSGGRTGAFSGLAWLAAVKPGGANDAAVQPKLQTFARSLAPTNLTLTGCDPWNRGSVGVLLSEDYLRTVADGSPDATVRHGIHEYTVRLAKGQSQSGTIGHGGAAQHADGSLHGSISWYGSIIITKNR